MFTQKYDNPMLELIDDMDIQVEYIGDFLVNQVIRKLMEKR